MATIMRLAPKLVVYGGALQLAMGRDADAPQSAPVAGTPASTGTPQAVDTPEDVVRQLRQQAMVAQFKAMGVEVTSVEQISDDEMEKVTRDGG
jgi:hypothetical protein